ncbi:hypothetical protein M0R45_007105 [Rubus argutus]|uniref:Uncharacterized protein n=1 Tax=Rubus argutus TaxID=59490 RepID=A0AAW1YSM1_RUBAR
MRRRSNSVPHGPQVSQLQIRSQPSEQSFSQGLSSQYGMFSQLSQTSLDALTDQRSQERENSVKKIACLPPISHAREESNADFKNFQQSCAQVEFCFWFRSSM